VSTSIRYLNLLSQYQAKILTLQLVVEFKVQILLLLGEYKGQIPSACG
jgi:hypothetical protein